MSKKMVKALSILLVAALMLGIAATPVLASVTIPWDNITISSNTSSSTATAASNISGTIIGVVQVIGVAVAVIMLIVLAIKYISAAPNDKAEIKKHAVVYVVGAVVLFAASGILEIIKNFANQVKA
ncbi:MAG: hypothetical protein IKP28_02610 [Clostridia bacterium]|nr:hypothetical protein [Clostridia bacterium]